MRILFAIPLCCLAIFMTACSPTLDRERFFWPAPPEKPQVEFIGVYSDSSSMKTGAAKAMQFITGADRKNGVYQPTAVTADGEGRVYASDSEFNRIVIFDFTTNTFGDYINEGLKKPYGLALDRNRNLYVVEREGAVKVITPGRTILRTIGQGELKEPLRIALDEERGRLYVSDLADQQVKVFTLEGQFVQAIGGEKGVRSQADGEFNRPNDLAVDRDGNLFVCDQLNARIQVFDPSGKFLRKFGVRGDMLNTFEAPMGIAIDNSNNIWIADLRKGALLTYSNTSDPQYLFATYGPSDDEGLYNLRTPMDVFIDKNSRIYVADSLTHRISVWQQLDEAYLAKNPLPPDWMQRTDILDRWFRESGEIPPEKKEGLLTPAKP